MSDTDNTYWWCLEHNRVETYQESDSPNRLGPFPTQAAAQDALHTMAERNQKYDKEDADWDNGG